jgi:type VI secretion system protein ImpA
MGSPEVLDFDRLLAPIPGENPAGSDPREDFSPVSTYREVRARRSDARQAERSMVFEDDEMPGPPADWRPILTLGIKLLAEQAKDLEAAALVIEGLVRREGVAGLRDGFRLARELCERFWDNLYPLPDEEGMVTRVAPLAGLNGEDSDGLLVGPIMRLPITDGSTAGPFNSIDHQAALELERIEEPDKRAARMERPDAVTLQKFDLAVSETSLEFVETLLEDLADCSREFESLCGVLEEKCGEDERGFSLAPPSSNIRNALRECRELVEKSYRHFLSPGGEAEEKEGGGQLAVGSANTAKGVTTREDAFRALLQVAEFFKRTEPHSPVSYSLEQAVRWGRMSLPELLDELIQDSSAREQLCKLVGIRVSNQ